MADLRTVPSARSGASAEARAIALAARQKGQLTRGQLLECGFTDNAIAHRVRTRWLVRRHRGVYSLAGAWNLPFAAEQAALLWAGKPSALGFESAGAAYLITPSPAAVHVWTPDRHRGRTPGVITHETETLAPDDLRTHEGLLLTSPLRTLTDLASTMAETPFERALGEAQVHRLVGEAELRDAAGRAHPGMPMLRAILDDTTGFTRNEAERELKTLLRRAGLPRPIFNAVVCGHEVDVYWPEQRLVIEFNGYGPHRTRKKFERDALKGGVLAAAGIRVVPATWRQLRNEPIALVARTAGALAQS